ncbi:hypothetical protein ACLOJK_004399 [Asimina triloba]
MISDANQAPAPDLGAVDQQIQDPSCRAASFHEQRAATSAPPKSASQQPCSATIKRGVAYSSKIGRHLHEPASANEPAIIQPRTSSSPAALPDRRVQIVHHGYCSKSTEIRRYPHQSAPSGPCATQHPASTPSGQGSSVRSGQPILIHRPFDHGTIKQLDPSRAVANSSCIKKQAPPDSLKQWTVRCEPSPRPVLQDRQSGIDRVSKPLSSTFQIVRNPTPTQRAQLLNPNPSLRTHGLHAYFFIIKRARGVSFEGVQQVDFGWKAELRNLILSREDRIVGVRSA